jgi:hypothetical protein
MTIMALVMPSIAGRRARSTFLSCFALSGSVGQNAISSMSAATTV